MNTGKIESFAGEIAEIGPMYPFVGWEMFFFILAVIFWIGWHIRQSKIEKTEYREEMDKYVNREVLERVLQREEKDPGV